MSPTAWPTRLRPTADRGGQTTSGQASGLTDVFDAHRRAGAALDDPGVSSLIAVAWAAGHLAAVARVLYPAAVRVLPYGRERVHAQLVLDHRLQQDLWRLDRLLTGDARFAGVPVRDVEDAVRRALQQHAAGVRRLVVELRAALALEEQHTLDSRLAAALRDGPTRPHPHTPHGPLAGRRTFWFWGAFDRIRDLLDSRSTSTPHPVVVPRRLGRWGAYLMGVPEWPTPGPVASLTAPAGGRATTIGRPVVRPGTAAAAARPTARERGASPRSSRSLLVWESEGGHLGGR